MGAERGIVSVVWTLALLATCSQLVLVHCQHVHQHGHCDHGHGHHEHTEKVPASRGAHDHVHSHEGEELLHEPRTSVFSPAREELAYQPPTWWSKASKSQTGLWLMAMGSSLAVSLASLICLTLLPFILRKGAAPSPLVVQTLSAFGAGAMLGDAFLHQLPHALGGGAHSHLHDADGPSHEHDHEAPGHAHSLADLTVGISILGGLLLFFLVEKAVRYVEEASQGSPGAHSHHHHHHHGQTNVTELQKGAKQGGGKEGEENQPLAVEAVKSLPVLGYLNLFSDGVHNFTDGMALGAAFVNHGALGGWSRMLFMLAHELPQEVGDFGILLRAGFSVSRALALNFLSATMAMAGTALALVMGGDAGSSSTVEGFTAGGFIYIAVAGVLPDMHSQGSNLRTTTWQLMSLMSGMSVALGISLWE